MSDDETDHDGAYKKLFSNEHMVEALITHFFSRTLGAELDFSTMASVDPGFLTRKLTRRTSDLIWKIPRDDTDDVFIILLLEFQSTPDTSMAMRILNYTSLLYDHLIGSDGLKKTEKLPPILPFVIYNGASTWTAATKTEALIDVDEASNLLDYQPKLEYYLIDIGRLDRVDVDDIEDPVSLLFELERVTDRTEIGPLFERLIELITRISESLETPFATWFERVMGPRTKIDLSQDVFTTLRKDPIMLSETIERWHKEATESGREEGREEGQIELIALQFDARFGGDENRLSRLKALTREQLATLAVRFVNEPNSTEDDLFNL